MPLFSLPLELRYMIITFAFPTQYDVSHAMPQDIQALRKSCKQLREETQQCLIVWRPEILIRSPVDIYFGLPRALQRLPAPRLGRLVVALFDCPPYEVQLPTMLHIELFTTPQPRARFNPHVSRTLSQYSPDPSYGPLAGAIRWLLHVHTLAAMTGRFTGVSLDLTPAPSAIRYERPEWLVPWLNDMRLNEFLELQIPSVAFMLEFLHISAIRPLALSFVGTVSLRSSLVLYNTMKKCRRTGVPFFQDVVATDCYERLLRGHYDTVEDVITTVIDAELASLSHIPHACPQRELWLRIHHLTFERDFRPSTRAYFVRRFAEDPAWTREQLRRVLIAFGRDSYTVIFEPEIYCRRVLLHALAHEFGYRSLTRGSGMDRYVVFRRE